MEDVVMSDNEDGSLGRSKFATERDEDEEKHVEVKYSRQESNRHTSSNYKRPRNDVTQTDDFTALLQSHETHKKMKATQENNENINNANYRKNKHNNNNHYNKNKNRNQTRNNNNKYNNNNNKRHKSPPCLQPRISTSEFTRIFGDPPSLSSDISEEEQAKTIAAYLEEQNVGLIHASIAHLGLAGTLGYVKRTAELEEGGGVMTNNHTRQRSVGGSFFYILKEGVEDEMKKKIFTDPRGKRYKKDIKAAAVAKNKQIQQHQQQQAKRPLQTPTYTTLPDDNTTNQDLQNKEQTNTAPDKNTTSENNKQPDTENKEHTNNDSAPDDQIQRIIDESLQT